MKLSKETMTIIKNFGNINSNLTFETGNVLRTISVSKNILASAHLTEEFEQNFGIYDVNEFLGVMSLFNDPDLTFTDHYVTIKEGNNAVKYFAANQSVLTIVPTTKPFPQSDITFVLGSANLSSILRVASILSVDDFSISGDGTNITILVGDKKNPTGSTFESIVGTTDKIFKVNMKTENIKLLPGEYTVDIGGKKICRFSNTNQDLVYHIAIERDSTFEF